MSRTTRPVRSREYKVMLRATKFEGRKADVLDVTDRFLQTLNTAIQAFVIPDDDDGTATNGKFRPREDEKQVSVKFLDTSDSRLRKSSFVFRQRQPLAGGEVELTLKCRHRDRFFVSRSETGGDTKFEEDIKTTKTDAFVSLYSLSGKVTIDEGSNFRVMKDIRDVYQPLKKQLGSNYDSTAKLIQVGDFTAKQTVLEGVRFQIDDDTQAKCALILWHHQSSKTKPIVVELSFRYKDKKLGRHKEPFTKAMARRCFDVVQAFHDPTSPLATWVDLEGLTKTAFVYSLHAKPRGIAAAGFRRY